MRIDIPGYNVIDIEKIVLDYNGTIALDGNVPESVKERLDVLSAMGYELFVLTADTHGTAAAKCSRLPVKIMTFEGGDVAKEKLRIVEGLKAETCAAIGNGRNDMLMCRAAGLSVAVIGREGAYGHLASETDVAVFSIEDGLDLFIKPKRLIATLRG